MKSAIDEATSAALTAERRAAPVPGGKVLQRLNFFNLERGLELTPPTAAAETGPSAEAESPTEDEGREAPPVAVSPRVDLAELYADTAQALAKVEAGMAAAAPGAAQPQPPAWRLVGPTRVPNGQTYGSSRIDVAGRVSAVAVDPSNANHVLCGAAGGGIWETRDGGATWNPRTDNMPTLTTGAIAFDQISPNLVYVGSGEGDFYWWLGAGLFSSTDGGASWSVLAAAPFVGSGFHDLMVDPADGNHLLAATTSGLYDSMNGGTVWMRRRTVRTWSLSMHPSGGAAAEVLAAGRDGLFRSTDGGQNWAVVTLPSAPGSWDRFAVDHVRANPAVAYAFGASAGVAYLYRRDSAGVWQRIGTPSDLNINQAWYDWFVAAAPDSDRQVYLGAIEVHRGDLTGMSWNWTNVSAKISGDSIHPDQHAIAFHPTDPNIVFVGNDGGLYRSPNRGIAWQSLNTGLAIAEIEYIAQDPGSSRWLIGGTQDNGTLRFRGGSVFDHIADGDGGDCSVNTVIPDTVFHSFFYMGLERSTDRGNTWRWIPTASRDPNTYRQLFYPPMEGRGDTIAQAGQSVFVSRNNGLTWTEVTLPGNPMASAMYLPTPDQIYVGTTTGQVFRIIWSGTVWNAATPLTTPRANAYVSDLYVDPDNLNRIWATHTTVGDGHVFRSDDGGSTWQDRSVGLPSLPVNAVAVDPGNADRVWVAADLGIYQSFDAGANWGSFSQGLPNALVVDLVFHPHARVLRAGTRNRGVWEIPVDGWLANPIVGVQWTGSLPGNGRQRWFTFNWPATWHVLWTVMPTSPHPGGPQVTWQVQVERANAEYATYWITVTNLTPDPVTFEGRYAILSRY